MWPLWCDGACGVSSDHLTPHSPPPKHFVAWGDLSSAHAELYSEDFWEAAAAELLDLLPGSTRMKPVQPDS